MEKGGYRKQLTSWWTCLENEFDNTKVLTLLFSKTEYGSSKGGSYKNMFNSDITNDSKFADSEKIINNCFVIRESFIKLQQFIIASHKNGCSDNKCMFNDRKHSLAVFFRTGKTKKIPTKRAKKNVPISDSD